MSEQRLIDANAFLERKKRLCNFETLKNWVNAEPTIDPVRHGKWELKRFGEDGLNGHFICSECNLTIPTRLTRTDFEHKCLSKYCPNCGAKMDKE